MVFPSTTSAKTLRSDNDFRFILDNFVSLSEEKLGFTGTTSFRKLHNFNPSRFTVIDFMHTVVEGHFSELLEIWEGKYANFLKLLDEGWLKQKLPSRFRFRPKSFELYS